jgi:nitrogen regulatory protein PII 1
MKMIKAIVRPEKAEEVAEALEAGGFPALTKMEVFGRGKQKGITVDEVYYDELPKTLIVQVVEDEEVDRVVEIIVKSAKTGKMGDGKIFVTDVKSTYTIRTGKQEL